MQIIIDQLLTNYQKFGEKGNWILILPGWKRNSIEWQGFAEKIAQDHQVIVLDLPGFGLSQKPKSNWDIFQYAHFINSFLKKINLKKYTLVGHSFGGRIGIILASQGYPIDQLILVDAAGIERKNWLLKLKLASAKILKPLIPKNAVSKLLCQDYFEAGEMKEIFKKVVNQDLVDLLPKIRVPVAIIWGEQDKILPLAHAKILHDKIKNSKLRIVWGAGHDPHFEKPDEFLEIFNEVI